MKKLLLFLTICTCTVYTVQAQHSTYIKTNILNLPIVPSLHIEQQIGKQSSLQLDFHRANFVFISETSLLNAALSYRKYLGKPKGLNGFYTGPSLTFHHNYLATEYIDSVTMLKGNSYIGAGGKFGFQKTFSKDRFVLDTNMGIVVHLAQTKDFEYFNRDTELRAMIGFGYRIRK